MEAKVAECQVDGFKFYPSNGLVDPKRTDEQLAAIERSLAGTACQVSVAREGEIIDLP